MDKGVEVQSEFLGRPVFLNFPVVINLNGRDLMPALRRDLIRCAPPRPSVAHYSHLTVSL